MKKVLVDRRTPSERSMAAQIANHVRWSKEPDRAAATAPARRGLEAGWAKEIDPDGVLAPAKLEKRIPSAVARYQATLEAPAWRPSPLADGAWSGDR